MLETAEQSPLSASEGRCTKQCVGILTGGGLAPGLNSVIAHATSVLKARGHEVIGIPDGWEGMLEVREDILRLSEWNREKLRELIRRPGSILGNSRPTIQKSNYDAIRSTAEAYGLSGIIPIGGDDTLGVARDLHEAIGLPCVGVPKTIDNDIQGTDRTFGFETAYHQTAERLRKLRVEAEGMRRIALGETMGRDAGWIALYGGKAGYADVTLIPEFPIDENTLMQRLAEIYNEQNGNGMPQRGVVVAIAEGYAHNRARVENGSVVDPFGHAKKEGAAKVLAQAIKKRMRIVGSGKSILAIVLPEAGNDSIIAAPQGARELKTTVEIIGYDTRSGEPVASDGIFAAELGALAGHLAAEGDYGHIVALRDGKITKIPIAEVRGGRRVTPEYYDLSTLSMKDLPWNIDAGVFKIRNEARDVMI